jgi:hypothetical protein
LKKVGIAVLFVALLLALATFGAGWKWNHGPPPPGPPPTAVADDSSLPDGWSWDL